MMTVIDQEKIERIKEYLRKNEIKSLESWYTQGVRTMVLVELFNTIEWVNLCPIMKSPQH